MRSIWPLAVLLTALVACEDTGNDTDEQHATPTSLEQGFEESLTRVTPCGDLEVVATDEAGHLAMSFALPGFTNDMASRAESGDDTVWEDELTGQDASAFDLVVLVGKDIDSCGYGDVTEIWHATHGFAELEVQPDYSGEPRYVTLRLEDVMFEDGAGGWVEMPEYAVFDLDLFGDY